MANFYLVEGFDSELINAFNGVIAADELAAERSDSGWHKGEGRCNYSQLATDITAQRQNSYIPDGRVLHIAFLQA